MAPPAGFDTALPPPEAGQKYINRSLRDLCCISGKTDPRTRRNRQRLIPRAAPTPPVHTASASAVSAHLARWVTRGICDPSMSVPLRCHATRVMTAVVSTASIGLRDQSGVSFVPGETVPRSRRRARNGGGAGERDPRVSSATPMRSHTQFPAGEFGLLVSFLPAPDRCWLVRAAAGLLAAASRCQAGDATLMSSHDVMPMPGGVGDGASVCEPCQC
jgi:hypothetical protein